MTANKENLDPQQYFFHVSGLSYKEPQRNEEVTFELEEKNRGLKAVNIQKKQNGKQ
jgi:cold shock CspA family protein